MNRPLTLPCLLASLFLFGSAYIQAAPAMPTADEVMAKASTVDIGDNIKSHMIMTVTNEKGIKKVTEMAYFRKYFGGTDGETRIIMFYTAPAALKDIGYLSIDYKNPQKDDDRYMGSIAMKKVRHIPTKDKRLAFMNSDFSYADMSMRDASNYSYNSIKEENLNGQKVWVIEGAPLNENAVADDGYTKSVFYVRQDNNILVRTLNYLKQGNKEKQMDVTNLKKIDGYWVMGEITMVTRKSGQELSRTSLKTADIKFNQKIDDSLFTEKQLTIGLGK